jgi:hypothetical protein
MIQLWKSQTQHFYRVFVEFLFESIGFHGDVSSWVNGSDLIDILDCMPGDLVVTQPANTKYRAHRVISVNDIEVFAKNKLLSYSVSATGNFCGH